MIDTRPSGPSVLCVLLTSPLPHETPLHWLGVSSYPLILRKSTCILVDVEVVVCLLPRLIYTFLICFDIPYSRHSITYMHVYKESMKLWFGVT